MGEDRWSHRSKYKRRNQQQLQNENSSTIITEYAAKQRIQELEQKNDELLDGMVQTIDEAQHVATDTLHKLNDQRHQLIKTDKNLYEINGNLDETKGILNGMKSWTGFIKKKFKKEKYPSHLKQKYEPPIPKKSVFNRNKKKRFQNKMNEKNNNNKYETDNKYNQKLDEVHKGIK